MESVVEISDSEGADDCVITSVVVVNDAPSCDLYIETCKENQLLADFIQECLKLENSIGMQNVLKQDLVKCYYAADKTARESPRFQKNLRRASYLVKTDPYHKFSHIQDLCNILKGLKAKKRVPFLTITNDITVNNPSKKAKLNVNIVRPFSETMNNSLNHSYDDTSDGYISLGNASQQSRVAEEDKLLIPKKDTPVFPTGIEKKIKAIEKKIAYYKKTIAILDEQEVDDDSVNSPYIKSERLKAKIVSLYKERCQLIGSQPVKCKGIRLKLAEGHPPGPTKVLERFLNKNCNKDGEPPFPDFCDVITCVTVANEKYDLGWTKAQIMNEATALFTLCGRALQKRRQNREYRDLMFKVKLEDLNKDPAEDDPQLQAKLEMNKCIAVKKESDILERYVRMQYLPSKSQKNTASLENIGTEDPGDTLAKSVAQQELIHTNSIYEAESVVPSINEYEKIYHSESLESTGKNIVIAPTSNTNVESHKSLKGCNINMNIDNEENSTDSELLQTADTKIGGLEQCNNVKDSEIEAIPNKKIRCGAGHKVANKNKKQIHNNNLYIDNDLRTNEQNVIKNPKLCIESIESPLNEDTITKLHKLGDKIIVTVEIMSDI